MLTVPNNFNILQKTQLKTYIEKAEIKCVKIHTTQNIKLFSLDSERKFTKPGFYILIDMNTSNTFKFYVKVYEIINFLRLNSKIKQVYMLLYSSVS